jgi:hypothetical protein
MGPLHPDIIPTNLHKDISFIAGLQSTTHRFTAMFVLPRELGSILIGEGKPCQTANTYWGNFSMPQAYYVYCAIYSS